MISVCCLLVPAMCRPIAHTTPTARRNLPLPLSDWRNRSPFTEPFKGTQSFSTVRAQSQEAVYSQGPVSLAWSICPTQSELREPWELSHADCDSSRDSGRTHSICPIWLSICQTQIRFVSVSISEWHTPLWLRCRQWLTTQALLQGCLFKPAQPSLQKSRAGDSPFGEYRRLPGPCARNREVTRALDLAWGNLGVCPEGFLFRISGWERMQERL